MGAKVSPEMQMAKRLVLEEGKTQYEAAKLSGITAGAISKAKWYRDYIGQKNAPGKGSLTSRSSKSD